MLALLLAGVSFTPQTAKADYASYIAGTNPVGWWGMNETSGTTTADLSGAFGAANNLTAGGTFGGTAVYPGGVPDPLGARNLDMTYGAAATINQAGFGGGGMGGSNKATYFLGAADSDGLPTASAAVAYTHATGPNSAGLPGSIYHFDGQTGFTGLSIEIWAKTDGITSQDSNRFIGGQAWTFGFQAGVSFGALHFTTITKQDYFGGAMPTDNPSSAVGGG